VLADDPRLDVRHVEGVSPIRVVLDRALRTPPTAALFAVPRPTWIFHGPDASPERSQALLHAGATLFAVPEDPAGLDLGAVLDELGRRDIVRLLVEGGPKVHAAMLAGGHADRLAVFVAPRVLGDDEAAAFAGGALAPLRVADGWRLRRVDVRRFGDDVLIEGDVVREAE
jgi:diaminohydroxyphosphoribosylaminopyrimidine deaminase / 5-amino-6-(5-phosphoribosylamino)uracil reductase